MKIHIGRGEVVWSYLSIILSMAVNFLLLPFYIYYLSKDILGLWYVFVSLGAIALLFDFGFSVTFSRNVTYCWSGANDIKKVGATEVTREGRINWTLLKRIITACKFIYGTISSLAFILLLTLGTYYICSISQSIYSNELLYAWLLYALGIFFNLFYSYYLSFLRGVGAIKEANQSVVFARLIQLIISIVLLISGLGIIGAALGYCAYAFGFRLFAKRKFFSYQSIGERLSLIKEPFSLNILMSVIRPIWYNAWRDGLVAVSNYISIQASILLCSLYISLEVTGVYSIFVQLTTAAGIIASTLYFTYQPALQEAYIQRDKGRIRSIMSFTITLFIIIFLVIVVGIGLVGLPILSFFKPSLSFPISLLLGIAFYQFLIFYRNCYTSYLSCTNRIIYTRSFIISSIIGLMFSLVFLYSWTGSIWGLILGQVLGQLVFNMWYWPKLVHKELDMPIFRMFKCGIREIYKKII